VDRVAPLPVEAPEPATEVAEVPTPAVTPDPAPEAEVVEEPRPEAAPEAASTQIVTEAVETVEDAPQLAPTASVRPRARPAAVTAAATPTPAASPSPAAAPKPAEPAPAADQSDAIADALAEALAEEVAAATAPAPATSAPAGPPVTSGEKDALRVAVSKCWNVGSLSSEALRVTVTVGLTVSQSGIPDAASVRMAGFTGGSEEGARQAFETARRAIIRCGAAGFPLPPEKYDQWRELELVFNPEGMRMR